MAKKRVSLAEREQMKSPIKSALSGFMSDTPTEEEVKDVAKSVTKDVADKETETETQEEQLHIPSSLTSSVKKIVIDGKSVTRESRKLKLGPSTFSCSFDNDTLRRSAYHLHEDTISKIEMCAKASGMKKAEFVDHLLNSVLTEVIEKVEKKQETENEN